MALDLTVTTPVQLGTRSYGGSGLPPAQPTDGTQWQERDTWIDTDTGQVYERRDNGFTPTINLKGPPGSKGDAGANAFQVAQMAGWQGTEQEWLASLVGAPGEDGNNGASAYQIAVSQGFAGTSAQYIASLKGIPGDKGDSVKGDKGDGATISVGSISTLSAGASATAVNVGSSTSAIINFGIPIGATGLAATVAIGNVTTGTPGSNASVSNSGTANAAILDFAIPRGSAGTPGTPGSAATVAIGTVTPLAAGAAPTVVNTGTAIAASFNFGIPAGATGQTGPAFTIAAPTVTALSAGERNGTAFQPRAGGACAMNLTFSITGILNVGANITVAISATQAGNYTTVSLLSLLLNAAGVGVSDTGTGTLLIPAGYWVKVTRSDIGILSSITSNRIVWNL